MITSFFALIVFMGLTIFYSVVKFFVQKKNNNTLVKIVTILYFLLVITSQYFLNLFTTKELCGSIQPGTAFFYTFIPWMFIFGSIFFVLTFFPGWKIPFSNTFGYLITLLLGIRSTFHRILQPTTTNNKMIRNIYEDSSLLINEFTPGNFELMWNKLQSSNILNKDAFNYKQKFKNFVVIKDYVSELIWLVLSGFLITSISYNSINNSKCNKDLKTMEKNHKKWESKQNKQVKEEKKPVYYVTD